MFSTLGDNLTVRLKRKWDSLKLVRSWLLDKEAGLTNRTVQSIRLFRRGGLDGFKQVVTDHAITLRIKANVAAYEEVRVAYASLPPSRPVMPASQISFTTYNPPDKGILPVKTAIVAHIYYFDVFEKLYPYFSQLTQSEVMIWYISCPREILEKVSGFIVQNQIRAKVMPVENRGRDVLPFLQWLPVLMADQVEIILKWHTKKSVHRSDGQQWLEALLLPLLKLDSYRQVVDAQNRQELGIVCSDAGFLIDLNPAAIDYGNNARWVIYLSHCLDVPLTETEKLQFVAGTMCYLSLKSMLPLVSLNIRPDEFEPEAGQLDGTLAHGIERAMSISCYKAGLPIQVLGSDRIAAAITG